MSRHASKQRDPDNRSQDLIDNLTAAFTQSRALTKQLQDVLEDIVNEAHEQALQQDNDQETG